MLFVHRHLNNVWYNKAHFLIGTPYLAIIAIIFCYFEIFRNTQDFNLLQQILSETLPIRNNGFGSY